MRFQTILWLGVLVFGAWTGVPAETKEAFPERRMFQFGEFTIEASTGDEADVEALAVKLADYKLPVPPAPIPARLSLSDLERRRDHFLAKVAGYLGLDKPTEKMRSVYDMMVPLWSKTRIMTPKELPRNYALWRRTEIVARIQSGQKIPGFKLDALGGVDFSFEFRLNSESGFKMPENAANLNKDYWAHFVYPIKIGVIAGAAPAAEISADLENMSRSLFAGMAAMYQNNERQAVFNVLHETTESGVVWHYLTSKDRRWFCDGVANYVAWKVIQSEVGSEDSKGYYDLPAELKKYEGEGAHIDLAAWPVAESLEKVKYAEDLNTANYAFATKVIADVCAKHGDGFLPEWFRQIGRTERERATMNTVYKAYKRLTGENLRDYLPKSAVPAAKPGG